MATLIPHFALGEAIGDHKLDIDVRNIRELLAELQRRYGPQPGGKPEAEFMGKVAIMVDGRNINHLQGMDTPLNADSTVWFLLPSGGG